MMLRSFVLVCVLPLALACGDGADQISLRCPTLLQGLQDSVMATLTVHKQRDQQGKPVQTVHLDAADDEYSASLRLRPGTYFLHVLFEHSAAAGTVTVASYADVELSVEARVDQKLKLDPAQLITDFDEDGDGISNLDEVRYGFDAWLVNEDVAGANERITIVASGDQALAWIGVRSGEGALVEEPEHQVTLEAYAIDRYEVSEERYRICVARGLCAPPTNEDRAFFMARSLESSLPAVAMTVADANAFCVFAGGRLPSEQEWEYAARPQRAALYPSAAVHMNGEARCNHVNARYQISSVAKACYESQGRPRLLDVDAYMQAEDGTTPDFSIGCASLPGSAASAHDGPCQMAGNVWEWTLDVLDPYPSADWSPPSPALTVIRGGSADSLDFSLRSTFRAGADPELVGSEALAPYIGLRCVYPL